MLTKYAESTVLEIVSVPKNAGHERLSRIRRQGHRHHFDFNPRPGYIYVRSRAISSRCNDNFDEFPAAEIKAAYRTFVGKPCFVNHHNSNHRRARGVIIDAALHEDTNPDGTEDTWAEVLMEIDAVRFPRLAEAVKKGDIARTSMGTDVAYSVCTACGNRAETPADYCAHIPRMKGSKYRRVNAATGQTEEVLIAERCYGLGFFENSLLVEDPADPTAYVLGVVDGDTGESLQIAAAKDQTISPSEHGDPRLQDAGVSVSKDDDGYYVHTHRARSDSYDSVADIPQSKIDFIESTGGILDDALNFLRGGVDERNQCPECGKSFVWNGMVHRFVCPNGHATSPAYATKTASSKEAVMCSECNPGSGLPDTLCAPHSYVAKQRAQWGPDALDGGNFISDKAMDVRALRKNAEWITLEYFGTPGTLNYEVDGVGEGQVFPTGSKWGWDVVVYDDPLYNPYGEADTKEEAMHRVEQIIALRRSPVFASHHHGIGETIAPAQVDTMRAEACPVCGDDEAFNGERCAVCGYQQPPEQFRDPDLSKAKEQDLRQDQAEQGVPPTIDEQGGSDELQCDNCGEVFSAEGDDDQAGAETQPKDPAEPDATPPDADPEDPEDAAPDADQPDDLSDLEDKTDDELDDDLDETEPNDNPFDNDEPDEGTSEDKADDDLKVEVEPTTVDTDPADDLSDLPLAVNDTCPVCGQGTLIPKPPGGTDKPSEPDTNEVGKQLPTGVGGGGITSNRQIAGSSRRETSRDMAQPNQPNPAKQARNRIIAALQRQQRVTDALQRENKMLREAVHTLATAAGVGNHPRFAALVRRKASEGGNDPEGAPATTTEEAKQPMATDDVESVGAAPAPANTEVTPDAVTDVNTTDVAVATEPLLDNLQDVTAPVAATDSAPQGDAAHVETEIRVSQPNTNVMDPPGSTGWNNTAAAVQQRFVTAMRLARLRAQAGIDSEVEDVVAAQRIASSQITAAEMDAEIRGLSAIRPVAAQQAPRHLVPQRAAVRTPSLAPTTASAPAGDDSPEFLFD